MCENKSVRKYDDNKKIMRKSEDDAERDWFLRGERKFH